MGDQCLHDGIIKETISDLGNKITVWKFNSLFILKISKRLGNNIIMSAGYYFL